MIPDLSKMMAAAARGDLTKITPVTPVTPVTTTRLPVTLGDSYRSKLLRLLELPELLVKNSNYPNKPIEPVTEPVTAAEESQLQAEAANPFLAAVCAEDPDFRAELKLLREENARVYATRTPWKVK
jgi:hypothetical protein